MHRLKTLILSFLCCSICTACLLSHKPPRTHAHKAEILRAEGKHKEAINEYLLHLQSRLKKKNRPSSENPYFYYLLIGDIHLESGAFSQARGAYEVALKENVTEDLVNERLRRLGNYLAEQRDYQGAISLLSHYRHLDPLLFDLEIDRIHKEMVRDEQDRAANN